MKELGRILFGFLCALLAVGIIRLLSEQPRGYPIQLTPPPTPAPLVVHISGAVRHPGVYQLKAGSRVWDAVRLAGGFSSNADQDSLNQAVFLEDGSRIHIPTLPVNPVSPQQETPTIIPTSTLPTPSQTVLASPVRINFPIDINTASGEELELLPQIGQVRAARILAYRQSHGLFKKIEDIRNVYDISPEVYAAIRDLITVSQPLSTAFPAIASPSP